MGCGGGVAVCSGVWRCVCESITVALSLETDEACSVLPVAMRECFLPVLLHYGLVCIMAWSLDVSTTSFSEQNYITPMHTAVELLDEWLLPLTAPNKTSAQS